MLNYREFLFKNIGQRIRKFRTTIKKQTQNQFVDNLQKHHIAIDRQRLSSIENGKINVKKNPHLLSATHIEAFSQYMECSQIELIFGNDRERSDFIKLILLGIIVNGDRHYKSKEIINPFINIKKSETNPFEFAELSMFNIKDKELQDKIFKEYVKKQSEKSVCFSKNIIKECVKWFKDNYGFFADSIQLQNMNYLLSDHFNENLQTQSNLLINILFSNQEFSQDFMEGKFNLTSKTKENLAKFVDNKGQFGGLAFSWKESGYSKFVEAFDEFWNRNKLHFIDFFEKNLFNIDMIEKGLKNQNDKYFHEVITSSNFQNTLYRILNRERYNIETMIGHRIAQNYIDSYLIELTQNRNELSHESGYNLTKYNYDKHQLSQSYNLLRNNQNNKKGSLSLFINDYFN